MKLNTQRAKLENPIEPMSAGSDDDSTPMPSRVLGSERDASSLASSKSAQVDEAYRNFSTRRDAGERIDPDVYCARFPSIRSALAKVVQLHLLLEENIVDTPEIRWPEPGEMFLDYQLKLQLGNGAFARVFLATEPKLGGRLVAVKIALNGAGEADVLGRIKHPNIVPVYSVHEDKATGLTAVCMPYVGSATLHDVLDRAFPPSTALPTQARVILDAAQELPCPLDPSAHAAAPDRTLQAGTYVDGVRLIGAQLAEALAYLHDQGLYHRDLKPSNVLLNPQGVPLLLDFNLCADAQGMLTRLGGTMPYMSPEQLCATDVPGSAGPDALDARSDIFSLGVILYLLLTGTNPFGPLPLKLTSAEIRRHLLKRQQEGPIEACRLNPSVDRAFSHLIQRCLAFSPQARPQTAAEVASSLRQALAPLPRTKRWMARNPRKALAAALLVAAVGVASLTFAAVRPPYSERQIDAGLRLYHDGRFDQAVPHFNDALQADPHNGIALFARARAHQQLGTTDKNRYNLAIQDYLEADKRNPDGRSKAAIGYCLNRTSDIPEDSIAYYQEALRAGFATAEVHNNVGYNCLRLHQLQPAKESLDRAIALDAGLQAAYHNRAFLSYLQAIDNKNLKQLTPAAKGKEVYRALESGIADAEKAISLGFPSAELQRDAAKLCAVAARVETRWIEAAVQRLEASIGQGMSPKTCQDRVFTPLAKNAAFQELAKRRSAGKSLPPTQRIVDPIKDLFP